MAQGQSIPTVIGRVKGSTPLFSTIALQGKNYGGHILFFKYYEVNGTGPEHPDRDREGQGFDSLILHRLISELGLTISDLITLINPQCAIRNPDSQSSLTYWQES